MSVNGTEELDFIGMGWIRLSYFDFNDIDIKLNGLQKTKDRLQKHFDFLKKTLFQSFVSQKIAQHTMRWFNLLFLD